jgi:type II secretory pathway pseudopilin PulG
MSTKAFTLPETLIATGISTIVALTMVTMMVHMAQSTKAIQNYDQFEQESRNALDKFTRDVRQANCVGGFSSNAIALNMPNGVVNYTYIPYARMITRWDGRTFAVAVRNCIQCQFKIYQRNPPTANYDQFFTTTDLSQAKLMEVNWRCASTNSDGTINSGSFQSAKVVIRKL